MHEHDEFNHQALSHCLWCMADQRSPGAVMMQTVLDRHKDAGSPGAYWIVAQVLANKLRAEYSWFLPVNDALSYFALNTFCQVDCNTMWTFVDDLGRVMVNMECVADVQNCCRLISAAILGLPTLPLANELVANVRRAHAK